MRGTCLNAVFWGILVAACPYAHAQDHSYDGGGAGGGFGGGDSGVSGAPSANDIANQVDRQYMDALAQKKSELAQLQAQLAQCPVDEARENGNIDAQLAQSKAQRAGQQAQNDGQNVLGNVLPSLSNLMSNAFGGAGQQKKIANETMDLVKRKVDDLHNEMMAITDPDNRPTYGVAVTKSYVDYTSGDVAKACNDPGFRKRHRYGLADNSSFPSSSSSSNTNSGNGNVNGMYPGAYGYANMDEYNSCVLGLKQELQTLDNRYTQARQDYLAGSGTTTKGMMDAASSIIGSIGNHALQKGANNLADNGEQEAANNQKQNAAYTRQACEAQAKEAIANVGKAIQQLDNGRGRALMDAALQSQMAAQRDKNAFNAAPNGVGAGGTVNVGSPDSLKAAGPQLASADKKDAAGGGPAGMSGGGGGGGGGGGAEWTFPPGGAPSSGGPSAPIESAQYDTLGGGGGGAGGGFGGDFGFNSDPNSFAMNKGDQSGLSDDGAQFGDGGINVLLNKMRLVMANHVGGENGLGMMARSLASAKDSLEPSPKKKVQAAVIQ